MNIDKKLLAYVERLENLQADKDAISEDQKLVRKEAANDGYDPKMIKELIRLRKLDDAERARIEAEIETYKAAIGMLDGTPLADAAAPKPKAPVAKKVDAVSPGGLPETFADALHDRLASDPKLRRGLSEASITAGGRTTTIDKAGNATTTLADDAPSNGMPKASAVDGAVDRLRRQMAAG